MEKELVVIDKEYIFNEIAAIYDLVENDCDKRNIMEELASLQSYCKYGDYILTVNK